MATRNLTNSMRSKWNACHRAYKISYVDGIRPAVASDALSFGTAMHSILESYWKNSFSVDVEKVDEICHKYAMDRNDVYAEYTLKALFDGYVERYQEHDAESYKSIGAEIGFKAPLLNPETSGVSKTFHLAGKIDAIAEERESGRQLIVEHKTTSSDIGPGSDYWLKLPIDGQVSGYYIGAKVKGYDVNNCLYDVIRKPNIRPSNSIPVLDENGLKIVVDEEGNRVMNKDGKKPRQTEDAALGYTMQKRAETPDEWFDRLKADIASNPDKYYQRMEVARSETDLQDYLFDMWALSQEIIAAEGSGRFSRNPNACSVFGNCEYFDVCTGCASLDDVTLFMKVDEVNPELN